MDPNGDYKQVGISEGSMSWELRCRAGYSPDPKSGEIARCSASGVTVPNPCITDPGCNGASAKTGGSAALVSGHTCPAKMAHGETCIAKCSGASTAIAGTFLCSMGRLVGESSCIADGEITMEVQRIAGSMSMDLSAKPTDDQMKLSLSSALLMRISDIVSLAVTAQVRRLRDGLIRPQFRRLGALYQVDYVFNVPAGSSANSQIAAIQSLSAPGSAVNQAFTQSLQNNAGITAGSISHLVAPSSYTAVVVVPPQTVTVTVTVTVNVKETVTKIVTVDKIVNVTVPVPVPVPAPAAPAEDSNAGAIAGAIIATFFGTLFLMFAALAVWYYRMKKGDEWGGADESPSDATELDRIRSAARGSDDKPEVQVELPSVTE